MQYIILIHDNTVSTPAPTEWTEFIARAVDRGLFRGGSEIGLREPLGRVPDGVSSDHIVGFMRFDSDERQPLLDLLATHPVVVHGGTVELCEMPKS